MPARVARPALVVVVMLLVGAIAVPVAGQELDESEVAAPEEPIEPADLDDPAPLSPPSVTAPGAVLWDPVDDLVLHGVAETVSRPMASTTKIMTTLLALEAGTVDDIVTVSPRAASVGEASLGLRAGQRLPMRSLVAGLLIRSGNDASLAVAEHVSGDESAFVELMNARAAELGLDATTFLNPSGLTNDPGHHASPLDLARLAHHAMADPVFAEYAGAATASVPGLPSMVNRNELLGVYPGATGVKTGYTRLAGLSLVASATRDGRTLYAVVLGSEDSFADAAALLDYGFIGFRRSEPATDGLSATVYRWADAEVDLVADGTLGATVAVDDTVTWRTSLTPSLARPAAAGAPAGTARLLVDGEVRGEVLLRLAEAVPERGARDPAEAVGGAVQEALRAFVRIQDLDRVG